MAVGYILAGFLVAFVLYTWHLNRALAGIPPEAAKFLSTSWTDEQLRETYRKVKESPPDINKSLLLRKNRRYIVVGGSGLVGGWIVNHLLLRGEDPLAIRILDLSIPQRPEIHEKNVQYISTDVTDPDAVLRAFKTPWKGTQIAKLPLTVFHCAAYIKPGHRREEFLGMTWKINYEGTKNVVNAARACGASCLVATASGSVGMTYPKFLLAPWKSFPKDFFQLLRNAEVKDYNAPIESYGTCYAYSKVKAEKLVRDADDKATGFRTGVIRPGHAIYGHGIETSSSVSWDYLRRGGAPTWLQNIVTHFVSAQNVSIAHLAFEECLINPESSSLRRKAGDVGGKAYAVTDPGGSIVYGDFYNALLKLAHPLTPMKFPIIPAAPMYYMSHFVEAWAIVRHRYLPLLPEITGDVGGLMPALFNVCTLHLVYDDSLAKEEIGYNPPITTMVGVCQQIVEWNEKVEREAQHKIAAGKAGDIKVNQIVPNGAIPAVKM